MTFRRRFLILFAMLWLTPAICSAVATDYITYDDPYGASLHYKELSEQEVATDLSRSDAYSRLGWIEHYFWGENDLARDDFKRSLALNPTNSSALEGLGIISMLSGDMDTSLRCWIDLGRTEPQNNAFIAWLLNLSFFADTTTLYERLPEELADIDAGEDFWLKDLIKIKEAQFLYERGDAESLQKVKELAGEAGYWSGFQLVGPFDRYGKVDLYYPFLPEKNPQKDAYSERPGEQWRPVETDADGYLCINKLIGADEGCIYLRTAIYSPQKQKVYLCFDADCAVCAWASGEKIYERNSFRDQRGEYEVLAVELQEGVTTLLIKCLRNSGLYYLTGDWVFGLRVIDEQGNPLSPKVPDNAGYAPKPQGIDPLFQQAAEKLGSESANPFNCLYNSLEALVYGYSELSIDLAERAVEIAPAYPYFRVMLAYIYISSGKEWQKQAARNQLNTAITLDNRCLLAQEELAYYYKSDGKQKQALDAYQATIELNPDYISAKLGLAQYLLDLHYEKEFLEQITAVEELYPDNPQAQFLLYQFYEQKRLYADAEEHLRAYLEKRQTDEKAWTKLAYVLEDGGDLKGAEGVWQDLLSRQKYDISYYVEMGRIQERLGDISAAQATYREAIANCPYSYKGFTSLALLQEQQGQEQEAQRNFKKAQELAPSDDWLSEYLRTTKGEGELDSRFDMPANEVLKSKVSAQDYPGADSVSLLDQQVVEIFPDYTFTDTIHEIIQIMNASGREKWGEFTIPGGEGTTLLEARTFIPGGGYVDASSIKDVGGSKVISLEGLSDGSIIEVEYRSNLGQRMVDDLAEYFYSSFAFCDYNQPYLLSRYIVIVPKDMEIGFAENEFKGKVEKIDLGDRLAFVFTMERVPGIISEPLMPTFTQIAPQVQTSTMSNPIPIIEWYRGELWGLTHISSQVKKKVEELCAGKNSDLERAKVLYYWVMHETKGYGGSLYYPDEADQTFYSKQGRPNDRAVLLMAMLSQVGIESELVLLSTSEQVKDAWQHPNSGIFDTCLLYLPNVDGKEYYLDLLIGDLSFGDFWSDAYGKKAAYIDDNGYHFGIVPSKPLDRDYTGFNATFEIGEDGGLLVKGSEVFFGLRGSYRSLYRDPRDRDQLIENMLTSLFPSPVLQEVEFYNLDEVDKPFYYTFLLSSSHYCRTEGEELVFSAIPGQLGLTSAYINTQKRRWPLKLSRTETIKDTVVVKLPENYEVVGMPKDLKLKDYFGEYRLTYRLENGEIYVERFLHLNKKTIKTSDYQSFIKFCAKLDEAEKNNIRIKPKGANLP
jgi:tetratricopeptide (TPR) repeat protein